MAQARYTIHVPQTGRDLTSAAHHWLHYGPGPKIESSHIHRDLESAHGMMDHIVAVAEDTPESDSHMKQLAHHIAEAGNLPHGKVLKENGKAGIQTWTIRNMSYNDKSRP